MFGPQYNDNNEVDGQKDDSGSRGLIPRILEYIFSLISNEEEKVISFI